ncbi:MAG: hypothetical protein ACOCZA_04270 [Spirochaetota bacterium]
MNATGMKSYSPESSDSVIGRLFFCLRSRRVHSITVNSAFYLDLKLSVSSAMLEEEELFGFSSQGFGSVQFGLMAGMKL